MKDIVIGREQVLAAVSCAGWESISIRVFQTLIKKLNLKWVKLGIKIDVTKSIDGKVFLYDSDNYYMLEDKVEGENYYERCFLDELRCHIPFGAKWQIKKDVAEVLTNL